jgi:hypothetical protein
MNEQIGVMLNLLGIPAVVMDAMTVGSEIAVPGEDVFGWDERAGLLGDHGGDAVIV